MTNDFPTPSDYATMPEVEERLAGLVKAQGEVGIRTSSHLEILRKFLDWEKKSYWK